MVENFRTSWFEDWNQEEKVVKIPYSGGYSKNYNIVFNMAFKEHDIKKVYYGMDIFHIFNQSSSKTRTTLPKYLYDENIWNDIQYIYNKDIIFKYTLKNLVGKEEDNDLAYNWNSKNKFGLKEALEKYTIPEVAEKEENENFYMKFYDENMKNVTEYIEKYPNTKFVIFFPPYSILDWNSAVREKKVNARMAVTKRVMEDLLKYDNVELYYFQNIENIITNMDNYKDITHYKEDINYYMFECMCKSGENRITKDNYIEQIGIMRGIVDNYNYSILFE